MQSNHRFFIVALCWIGLTLAGCESNKQHAVTVLELQPDSNGIVTLSPGDTFSWIANTKLTAQNECTLVLPSTALDSGKPISSIIDGHDDMGFIANDDGKIYLGLRPEMSVTIKTSCETTVQCPSSQPVKFAVESSAGDGG